MISRSRSLLLQSLSVALLTCGLMMATGCSKKNTRPEVRLARTVGDDASGPNGSNQWGPNGAPNATDMASSMGANGSGMGGDGMPYNGNTSGIEGAVASADLGMIHFAYDSCELTSDWKAVLEGHATWLNNNPNVNVLIEGHCDERGTDEYNIALGQLRADAARTFLSERGVDNSRLSTISYGKARPMNMEDSDNGHALNRRDMFLVYEKGSQVAGAQ